MNKKQRVLLVLSIISYLIVLGSFFLGNMVAVFAAFVMSSAFLISFCMSGSKEDEMESEYLELCDVRSELESVKQEKEQLSAQLSEARQIKEADDRKIRIAEAEIENTKEELKKSKEEESKLRIEVDEVKKDRKSGKIDVENGSLVPGTDETTMRSSFNIIALTKEVIEEFESFAEKVGVMIRLNTTEQDLEIEADRGHIRVMLRNIVDNSLKYMQTSGTLVITISRIEERIFIVLKDNGEGLSESETEHVFELNFQGSNRISGNGLGLTQAKAIVDFYNGDISARSGNGNGMAIYIELPRIREEA